LGKGSVPTDTSMGLDKQSGNEADQKKKNGRIKKKKDPESILLTVKDTTSAGEKQFRMTGGPGR